MLRQASISSDILMSVNPQHPAGGHEAGRNMRVVTVEKPILIWNGNLEGLYYRADDCSLDTYLAKYTYMKGDRRVSSKRHIHEVLQEACIKARYKLDDVLDKKERSEGSLSTAALGVVVGRKNEDGDTQLAYLCAPIVAKDIPDGSVRLTVKSEPVLAENCKEAVFYGKQEHIEIQDIAGDKELYFIGRERALANRIAKIRKNAKKALAEGEEERVEEVDDLSEEDTEEQIIIEEEQSEDEDGSNVNGQPDNYKILLTDDTWCTKKAIKDYIRQLPRSEFKESSDIVKAKCYAGRFSDSGLSFFMINGDQLKSFYHSEQWLLEMLRVNPDLPAELLRQFKITPSKFEVHAIMIEIHSERDICSNCQDHLHHIITDKSSSNLIRHGFKKSLQTWGYSIFSADLQIGARVSSRMCGKSAPDQMKDCGCPEKIPRPFPTEDVALQDLMQNGVILAHRFVPIAFHDHQGSKCPACPMIDCKSRIRDEKNFLVEIGKKLQEMIVLSGVANGNALNGEETVVLDIRDDTLGDTKHPCPSSTNTNCTYTSLTAYAKLDLRTNVCKGVKLYLTSYVTEKVNL
ncbi:uncharacterized protein LOC144359874 [Saccoglossus kowalevskii]